MLGVDQPNNSAKNATSDILCSGLSRFGKIPGIFEGASCIAASSRVAVFSAWEH